MFDLHQMLIKCRCHWNLVHTLVIRNEHFDFQGTHYFRPWPWEEGRAIIENIRLSVVRDENRILIGCYLKKCHSWNPFDKCLSYTTRTITVISNNWYCQEIKWHFRHVSVLLDSHLVRTVFQNTIFQDKNNISAVK